MQLNEHIINIWEDNKDDKNRYLDEVWDIFEKAYAKIGGCNADKKELLDDNIYWKLTKRDNKITAACIYKILPFGRKLFLIGSDGTDQGKKDLYKMMSEDSSEEARHVYAEVSDAPEHIYHNKYNAPYVDRENVKKILGPSKQITPTDNDSDEYHYTREIGPQKNVYRKAMIGYPKLESLQLNEDKSISFNGEISPQFGWCIIVIGGPGSGKSSIRPNNRWFLSKLHLPFKAYDTDDLKWLFDNHKDTVNNTIRLPKMDGGGYETVDLDKAMVPWPPNDKNAVMTLIGEPYDMSNPLYVSFLHYRLNSLSKRYMKQIQAMGKTADRERLPNILFDISGDDISKIEDIVVNAKEVGYKTALVWVYADIQTALKRNAERDRKGDVELIINKHAAVKETIRYFIHNKYVFDEIDEFWVVISDQDADAGEEVRAANAYHVASPTDLQAIADKHHALDSIENYLVMNECMLTSEEKFLLKLERYGDRLINRLCENFNGC